MPSNWPRKKFQFANNWQSNLTSERPAFPIELKVTRGRGASTQLHLQLREAILEGRLATGFRLPPTRDLARMLSVARATVVVAYEMLAAEGYVRVRQGDGTFVQSLRRVSQVGDLRRASPVQGGAVRGPRFDLRLGYPDVSRFPFDVWRRLESRAWRSVANGGADLSDPAGLAGLREAIVGYASFSRAVSCTADDIVVTSGARQAFDLLARTLAASPGTVVAVEDPGYTPTRNAFAAAGARIVGVPVDAQGMVVSHIPPEAKVICVTPSHQFPLGIAMSPERRAQLLDHARRRDAYVVEDDYDCEYRYDSRPLDALQILEPGRVCYVGTFSKTMFPALRLGYAIVPAALRGRLLALRGVTDGFGAPAPQLALTTFIGEGHLHRHVRRMQRIYTERREALLSGLRERLDGRIAILPSKAGLHFSFRGLSPINWAEVETRAAEHEIAFERCSRYAITEEVDACCAIGFGLLTESQLAPAVDRLARLFG